MFEDRLLFTGNTKEEAYQAAKTTLDDIELQLSEWKGRPMKLCNVEEIDPPVKIHGTTYYYNIVEPLDIWENKPNKQGKKCNFTSVKLNKKEKYKKELRKQETNIIEANINKKNKLKSK